MEKENNKIKTYILDTNILMTSPYSIYSFDEHNVVIVDVTLEELDRHKSDLGERGMNAREAIRLLSELRESGSLLDGIKLPDIGMGSGILRVEVNCKDTKLPEFWDANLPDNRILRVLKGLKEKGESPTLITNDINLRIKADILGISAEEYKTEQVASSDMQYTGRGEVFIPGKAINKFYESGVITIDDIYKEIEEEELVINKFFLFKDECEIKHSALARFDGENFVPLKYGNSSPYGITARNSAQRFAIEALLTPASEASLCILKGPAGCAKTFLALACGLENVANSGDLFSKEKKTSAYTRILCCRPNVKFDNDIGFLKGSEKDKIDPLIRPIYDNLEQLTKSIYEKDGFRASSYVEDLFTYDIISAEALAYMRGRSIANTYIIIDEAQNMTPTQAFGIVSRAGVGSKVILCGDPDQIDDPRIGTRTNGLSYAAEKMKGSPLTYQLTFNPSECERSPLALEAISRMSPKGAVVKHK